MCDFALSWSLIGKISVLAFLVLAVMDLMIRYLNNNGSGLIPYKLILSPFFLNETTFQDVDKKRRKEE